MLAAWNEVSGERLGVHSKWIPNFAESWHTASNAMGILRNPITCWMSDFTFNLLPMKPSCMHFSLILCLREYSMRYRIGSLAG